MAVGATEQPPAEELARRIDEAALAETRSKLEGFLDETQRVGVSDSPVKPSTPREVWAKCRDGCRGGMQTVGQGVHSDRQGFLSTQEPVTTSRHVLLGASRLATIGVPPGCPQIELEGADLAEWRRQLAACTDPASFCRFLLAVEEVYCHAGEGLPRGEPKVGHMSTQCTLRHARPA